MKKSRKITLIVAISLVAVIAITIIALGFALNFQYSKLWTNEYQTRNYEFEHNLTQILVNTQNAGVLITPSEDGKCRVVCEEQVNMSHIVSVIDGKLQVNVNDKRAWHEKLPDVSGQMPQITIYLPKTAFTALTINANKGDVGISKDFIFSSIQVSVETGDVNCYSSVLGDITLQTNKGGITLLGLVAQNINVSGGSDGISLTDINCSALKSEGKNGDISLQNVIVAQNMTIKRTSGDVVFSGSNAPDITVTTEAGSVSGSLLSSMEFIAKSRTGSVNVPASGEGGTCRITTDTGNISITTPQ